MQNKLMALLLCLCNVMLFAHPTYCFKNNADLDTEIGFTSGANVQQLCGDHYEHGEGGENSVTIAPGEAVLLVCVRKIDGFQNTPEGYKVKERQVNGGEKYWGGFDDNSNLAPFNAMYGEDIKRAFLITDAESDLPFKNNTK